MNSIRIATKCVTIILPLLIVGSCAQPSPDSRNISNSSSGNIAEAMSEYDDTAKALTLPKGAAWPSATQVFDFVLSESDGSNHSLSEGYGKMSAQDIWRCAWEFEALEAKDATRKSKALEVLGGYKDMDVYKASDPSTNKYDDEVLATAKLGDYSLMKEDTTNNCTRDWIYSDAGKGSPK